MSLLDSYCRSFYEIYGDPYEGHHHWKYIINKVQPVKVQVLHKNPARQSIKTVMRSVNRNN